MDHTQDEDKQNKTQYVLNITIHKTNKKQKQKHNTIYD